MWFEGMPIRTYMYNVPLPYHAKDFNENQITRRILSARCSMVVYQFFPLMLGLSFQFFGIEKKCHTGLACTCCCCKHKMSCIACIIISKLCIEQILQRNILLHVQVYRIFIHSIFTMHDLSIQNYFGEKKLAFSVGYIQKLWFFDVFEKNGWIISDKYYILLFLDSC